MFLSSGDVNDHERNGLEIDQNRDVYFKLKQTKCFFDILRDKLV